MLNRPRRNRKNENIRRMISENGISEKDLIYPLFLIDSVTEKEPIKSMPGIYRWGLEGILFELEKCLKLGIKNFALFPVVDEKSKNSTASFSYKKSNFYIKMISLIKSKFPECTLMTDVAMDPYSSDGHDGLVVNGEIMNDESLPILAKMAVLQAEAGADIIGPSDMMDGRIKYIRAALDEASFTNTSIMSYTVKYASTFYGPFREALDSKPKSGDKKTYQMDPANSKEAIREALYDQEEGADILMVKPGLAYLDIVSLLKQKTLLPIAVYNVSGEYAMIKAAAKKGWIDEKAAIDEVLLSFKRAGADIIVTYFAKDFALNSQVW